jgi:glycerol kinase
VSGGSILVVDVGTSGVRAAIVRPDATVEHVHHARLLPDSPAPGLVEFDATQMADAVLTVAAAALADGGPVAAVGIANQRASSIVWDRATGKPVAPGIGWQDLRTVGTCLVLQSEGIRLAPNASATKVMAILDEVDPERARAAAGELCFGTVDSWVAWTLSGGAAAGADALHVTDATNAAVTALVEPTTVAWDESLLARLNIPLAMLPTIVDSSGAVGACNALPGAPTICGIAGDQQASLVGQGCTRPGLAKATFGTGGMLDQCTGPGRGPAGTQRGAAGTFPIVAYQVGGAVTWGVEAVMLSAGTCVEWLRRPRDPLLLGGIGSRGRSLRDHGRRVVRAGPARHGHAGVGLRCPGHPGRSHSWHRALRNRARRARGRRPPRCGPRRGGGGGQRFPHRIVAR